LGRDALKTDLSLASDVMEGPNVTQAAKSRLKSTGQNLLQKAMDTVGPPGERSIERAARRKKPRRRETKPRNTSKDVRTIGIHDLCFHKQESVEQVDVIVSSSTDCKFIRTLVRKRRCQSFLIAIAMFHTGLSRGYSKQIQFRFRTFARVLMY
jgi:hypothetical protein